MDRLTIDKTKSAMKSTREVRTAITGSGRLAGRLELALAPSRLRLRRIRPRGRPKRSRRAGHRLPPAASAKSLG